MVKSLLNTIKLPAYHQQKAWLLAPIIAIIIITKVSHPSISWVFQPNCFANTHEREPLTHV